MLTQDEIVSQGSPHWSVAVFACREDISVLTKSIDAIIEASYERSVTIYILINGNRSLLDKVSEYLEQYAEVSHDCDRTIELWWIREAGKANAWNQFVHHIWNGSDTCFFVDGYVQVHHDALYALDQDLHASNKYLGATGVPSCGRSAKKIANEMLSSGGLHGNLFAVRADVLRELKRIRFFLPFGLYRVDSVIGAVLAFNFDPASNKWDMSRLYVNPSVNWRNPIYHWWKPVDVISHLKRMLRQAQGQLENWAVKDHLSVAQRSPQSLPPNTGSLIINCAKNHPKELRSLLIKKPLCWLVYRRLADEQDVEITTVDCQLEQSKALAAKNAII